MQLVMRERKPLSTAQRMMGKAATRHVEVGEGEGDDGREVGSSEEKREVREKDD